LKGGNLARLDSFENTHDLLGDLFGAKNAGVTVMRLYLAQ
jgi:hypothetical protein